MPSIGADKTGREYWRSLDELAETPAVRAMFEREFSGGAWERLDAASRRQFLKVMGASLALAGMTGCRWPKETIVPYASRPGGRTPGVPERYATAVEIGGVATGLLVTSYDGRPIKIEGNPQHPFSLGATNAIHQASLLELYDPDRSRVPIQRERGQIIKQGWNEFAAFGRGHFANLRTRKGKGLAILSEATSSPSVARLRTELAKTMPEAGWYEYEPISWDNEREGIRRIFGKPLRPHYHFDRADVIVCLDADPLMTHPAAVRYARDFAKRRRAEDGTMNRLYVIESTYSITGSMADHRLAIAPSRIEWAAWALLTATVRQSKRPQELAKKLLAFPLKSTDDHGPLRLMSVGEGRLSPQEETFVSAVGRDVARHPGRCMLIAGERQAADVHKVVHDLNRLLCPPNVPVTYTVDPEPGRPSHIESIRALAKAIQDGAVDTLLMLGGNPVYDAPADVEFAGHLSSVKTSIHLTLYGDETSAACTWHVPRAHYLESWGDARAYDGTISIVQPLIEPLYGGKTSIELLAMLLGQETPSGYDIVRKTAGQILNPQGFEGAWRKALHDGVVSDTAWPQLKSPKPWPVSESTPIAPSKGGFEVAFCQDHSVYDGRFANNGWLQEWPDPMTRLTWDNAALVGPATAKTMGVANGDMVRVKASGRQVELPVYVMPGQAEGTIAVSLGYGRTKAGHVGDGVGVDVYPLRTSGAMAFVTGVEVEKVTASAGRHALATTQDQYPITAIGKAEKRKRIGTLIREATLAEYKAHPDFAKHAEHHPPLKSLWTEHPYGPHRWAMAIDLSACIGCGACVVACQAENNVPVVGKEQVANGRAMHWLRVDRYFKGDPDAPAVAHQPVMCMHCENAPCEQVCPVAATVHDKEGLNVMVYNRCVGTRYCSNNCPFKVRRFNFFNYRTGMSDVEKMAMNPEVTVRSRGVMEKCTYCLQRIRAVKIVAKNERRPIRDGEIVPACAQVCPTRAIVFGDLADKDSHVSKLQASDRAYHMLASLNVKTRTAYLAKLRNPNPELSETGYS